MSSNYSVVDYVISQRNKDRYGENNENKNKKSKIEQNMEFIRDTLGEMPDYNSDVDEEKEKRNELIKKRLKRVNKIMENTKRAVTLIPFDEARDLFIQNTTGLKF